MKTKSILLSLIIVCLSLTAFLPQLPPVNGVGVVVKRKPNGTVHKSAATDTKGSTSLDLEPGSYTLSLDEKDLNNSLNEMAWEMRIKVGKGGILKTANIMMSVARNKAISIAENKNTGFTDVVAVDVKSKTQLQITLSVDPQSLQASAGVDYVPHVTLLK